MDTTKFIFYRQWWDTIEELDPADQINVYRALMAYAFNGEEPADKLVRALTHSMRMMIDENNERYKSVCDRNRSNGQARRKAGRELSPLPQESDPPVTDCPVEVLEITTPVGDIEEAFDQFRKLYPGKKRGFTVEFDAFKRKYPREWRGIIPLLSPALERMLEWTERAKSAGVFVPHPKNLSTWLNQQCWTEEYPEITDNNQSTSIYYGINKADIESKKRCAQFTKYVLDEYAKPDEPEFDIDKYI